MKAFLSVIISIALFTACNKTINKEVIKEEILATEKSFEKMAAENGIAQAFHYYADENAVIIRENDTIIKGKENIKIYYDKKDLSGAVVNWTPDFIEVSDCGTLGYTYGKYIWKMKNANGEVVEHKGVFHTVWKRQKNNTWKYVWD